MTSIFSHGTAPFKNLGMICYSSLRLKHWENLFHYVNNLHQNIKFVIEEESNGKLAFLDTSVKRNNEKISLLVYRKPTHTDQNLH